MTCFLRLNLVAVTKQFERELLILNACTLEGRKVIDFALAQVSILKTKYTFQPIKKGHTIYSEPIKTRSNFM